MAITAVERLNIIKLTVALYNAAPGASGLSDFSAFYEANGRNLNTLALNLSNNNIFKSLYPNFQTGSEFATQLLSTYGLQNNTAAIDFVTSRFNAGVSKGQIAYEAALAVNNTTATTGDFATARALFNNKALVAENYSVALSGQSVNIGTLQGVLSSVTADPASVAAANNTNLSAASQSLQLTTGQDNLSGTVAADTFISNVVQNSLGLQVNTLGSGDNLNGGAGTDTLDAKVTAGAFAAGTLSIPIQPETRSVEIIKLQAVSSGVNFSGDTGPRQTLTSTDTQVYVNARNMVGVNKIGSNYSDADLIILNANTLDNAGIQRAVSDLTIGMEYTGNGDSRFGASDLSVYFDQDYLTAAPRSSSSLELRLVNNLELAQNNKALTAFQGVSFFVGGRLVTVDITPAITGLTGPAAYNALVAAIQARLTELSITDVTVSTLPVRSAVFTDDLGGFLQGQKAGDYTPILLVSRGGALARGEAKIDNTTLNFNGLNTQVFTSESQNQLVTINVDLEKAGLAGDGGNLIVGSMNKTSANVFGAVTTNTATKSGIEQFNVSVKNDATKSTSLASLQSTNNNLRVVNATTDSAVTGTSFAGLEIGNTQTGREVNGVQQSGGLRLVTGSAQNVTTPIPANQLALKDVQTFNAAGLKGDLTLFAALTNEVVPKYMNLTDSPAAAGVDNVAFTYTGGTGNDYINLYLSADNLAAAGTTTREDFGLTVNGGAGNDEIVTIIGNGQAVSRGGAVDNWYLNSKINANLAVNGGAGDDTIRTLGAGDYVINAGDGNDTVYSDNSGNFVNNASAPSQRAVYVFNAVDDTAASGTAYDINNLLSQNAATVSAVNANLVVTFRGIQSKLTPIANSVGSLTNVAITDLSVNQAIKEAINKDVVLNKLVIALDGPGRTLVVRSLIDGVEVVADLGVAFSTTAFTASQTAVSPALSPFVVGTTGYAAVVDGYVTNFGQITGPNNITGTNSTAPTDSVITGGLGNDVIVLSTNKVAPALADSNETVKYDAGPFGNDTVVNFVPGTGPGTDKFDFVGLGGDLDATFTNFQSLSADKSIVIQTTTTLNDTAAKVAGLFADSATALTHVFVGVDGTNIGSVYSVVDAAGVGVGSVVATLVGTIDLADTPWGSLSGPNFV